MSLSRSRLQRLAMACVVAASFQVGLRPARAAATRAPIADEAFERLLERAREYVAQFTRDFKLLVGDEDYQQTLRDSSRERRHRNLLSEVFFVGVEAGAGSLTVRSTQEVDGRRVRNSSDRIREALSGGADGRGRLRALADEGARYNLGSLERNFNDPTLALLFAGRDVQRRFSFRNAGTALVNNIRTTRVGFRERERPTLIRDGRTTNDIPASGTLFISDDGTVWQTELTLETGSGTIATVRVSYRRDERLDLLVPAVMNEDYQYRERPGGRTMFITCRAVYSNFRRFETSGRVVEATPVR